MGWKKMIRGRSLCSYSPRVMVVVAGGGEGRERFNMGGRGGSHWFNPSAINIEVFENLCTGNGDVATATPTTARSRWGFLGSGGENGGVRDSDGDGHVDAGFRVGNYHILVRHLNNNYSTLFLSLLKLGFLFLQIGIYKNTETDPILV